jgi:thiamine-monophosphate kinase
MKDEEEGESEGHPEASARSFGSESDFINFLRQRLSESKEVSSFIPHPSSLMTGIGDDAAVFAQQSGRDTVITADLLVEDIDFIRDAIEPELLGHKSLAVSLSDIAAMGAGPRWAMVSLGIPRDIWKSSSIDRFYQGFLDLAKRFEVSLIGGDVSRAEKLVIDSIVLGDCAHRAAVVRSGAQPGDQVYVTGALGGSAAGLKLVKQGARLSDLPTDDEDSHLVASLLLRHLRPEPRVGWGLVLGQQQLASAMIDISDGLSSDLHHLCAESNVGAIINSADIPLDHHVVELCGHRKLDPLILALNGGEDFELLFTVSPQNASRLPRKVDGIELTRIGEIVDAAEGIRIREGSRVWDFEPRGWDHFRS